MRRPLTGLLLLSLLLLLPVHVWAGGKLLLTLNFSNGAIAVNHVGIEYSPKGMPEIVQGRDGNGCDPGGIMLFEDVLTFPAKGRLSLSLMLKRKPVNNESAPLVNLMIPSKKRLMRFAVFADFLGVVCGLGREPEMVEILLPSLNEWHDIVIDWQPNKDAHTVVRLFVNGVQMGYSIAADAPVSEVAGISIGGPGTAKGLCILDDVNIYDSPLDVGTLPSKPLVTPPTHVQLGNAASFDILGDNSIRKPDWEPYSAKDIRTAEKYSLLACRGETEGLMLIISPTNDAVDCSLTPTFKPLTSSDIEIPAQNIRLYGVGFVNVTNKSGLYGSTGMQADPLFRLTRYSLSHEHSNPFLLLFDIPSDTTPGAYTTEIRLEFSKDGEPIASVPIKVDVEVTTTVLPFPSDFVVSGNIRSSYLAKLEGGNPTQLYLEVALYLARRRYNYLGVLPHVQLKNTDGNVEMDSGEFERALDLLMASGVRMIHFPARMFVAHDRHRWPNDTKWTGINPPVEIFESAESSILSQEFMSAMSSSLDLICAMLEKKAALDSTVVSVIDEPFLYDELTLARLKSVLTFVRTKAPRLRLSVTAFPHRELFDLVDIWLVNTEHYSIFQKVVRERQAAGDIVLLYNNAVPLLDYPLQRVRTFPWALFNANVSGVLAWWGMNNWEVNPWDNPESVPRRGNGNGSLLYPARARSTERPCGSLRLEAFRDGLEDLEIFRLLIANGGDPGRELLQQIRLAAHDFPKVSPPSDDPCISDVLLIANLRERAIRALAK